MKAMLQWAERALWVIGVLLAAWCAAVLVEARFTNHLPIRATVNAVRALPGDAGANAPMPARATPAPAPGTVLGRLEVPRLQLSTTVLEGTDDGTLRRGAGHIEDTPLPGQAGNVGIAGHRDTVFRALRNVRVGDTLDLQTRNGVQTYRVTRTLIVKPEDVYVLDPTSDPTLTLVTCYPFEYIGHAPKRFIVQAKRAP